MNEIKINGIELKKNEIVLCFKEIQEPLEGEFFLLNEQMQNQIMAKIVQRKDGIFKVNFPIELTEEMFGNFGVFLKKNNSLKRVLAEQYVFTNLSLTDYMYDEDTDLYIRYFENEDRNLEFAISSIHRITGKEVAEIKDIKTQLNEMELFFENDIIGEDTEYRFFITPARKQGMWVEPVRYDRNKKHLKIDMSNFVTIAKDKETVTGKWRMYLEVLCKGKYHIFRIGCENQRRKIDKKTEDFYDYREKYKNPLCVYEEEELKFGIYPYFTENGNVALLKRPEHRKYVSTIMNKILNIQIKRGKMQLVIQAHKTDMKISSVVLFLRTKKIDEKQSYSFPVKVETKTDCCLVTCDMDLRGIPIRPLYWDVRLCYEKDGVEYYTKMTNHDHQFYKAHFMRFFSKNTIKLKTGEIFYPYMTVTGLLAFQCREKGKFDGYIFKIKERLAAIIYFVLKSYWINKNIYLVFEKFCVMAQDNGYYFFQYCMENDVEKILNRKIYYVMDKNSPDWDKVAKYKDRVIPFMSLKHMVYLLASKLLISTDTRDHVYAWRSKDSILAQYLDSKKLVFLQHGVIALKRVHFLYSKTRRGRCNLFITSNDMERDIIYNFFGYKMSQIAVTGLARWDVLEDCSEGRREILIMPTWRNWLDEVGYDLFKESDYYKNYMAFLNSEKLEYLLEQYDLKLNFYLHPKFREYIGEFKINGDKIRLIPFGEEPLNELMMKCKLLVTDYSSVCWDVFYQSKPVIFYQFDVEEYNLAHGSYIDFETELFGDRVEKEDELIQLLEDYTKNNFVLKEKYAKMQKDCYKYIDKQNSQRICDEIIKRGW